ncbi:class I SAM-dependent methyltransferase [Coralloluteibacterium thermophilus]|uniref:Class I SAM-dependent methyltransferase n=1 Tax=Coralloluteibacterium thermophilum TaxID=2707049 RepID=A0ABV9NIQ5_9GAMM
MTSLFQEIEALHGATPWGAVLDAGSGPSSIRWIETLPTARWTAVTGAPGMADGIRDALRRPMRDGDRVVLGNWQDPDLLACERYDTVLADYLLGAIEGFAPYWQDLLFERLRPLTAGRLYVIGTEPYVPVLRDEPHARLVGDIGRLRDACLLMVRDRPYREFPIDWTLRHLERAGFRPVAVERYPIRYGRRFVDGQLDMCLRRLPRLHDPALETALRHRIETLRARAHAVIEQDGALRHGADYIVAAD